MQTLSKVPFDQLRVGDRVKSRVTNNEGFIYRLIDISEASRQDDNEIVMKWPNGSISYLWHYNCDVIWLM